MLWEGAVRWIRKDGADCGGCGGGWVEVCHCPSSSRRGTTSPLCLREERKNQQEDRNKEFVAIISSVPQNHSFRLPCYCRMLSDGQFIAGQSFFCQAKCSVLHPVAANKYISWCHQLGQGEN